MSSLIKAIGRKILPIFDIVTRRHVILRELYSLQERLERVEVDQQRLIRRFDVTLAAYEQRIDNFNKKISEFVSKDK